MHARKGKRGKKKLSEIWCDMHVFVLYGSVDAALGKLESKKSRNIPPWPLITAVGRLPRSNLMYIGGTCMKKAGY